MKKFLNLSIIMILSVFAIRATSGREKSAFVTGTYGVTEAADQIILQINADHTFHYADKTLRDKVIDIRGKWTRDGNTIVLENYKSERAIHSRWKIDSEYPCLRSRKALEWRRLCLLKAE